MKELVFLCFLLLICRINGQGSCAVGDYNLTPLMLPSNSPWFYNATFSHDAFYWNICGTVQSKWCTTSNGVSVCQQFTTGSQYSAGVINYQVIDGSDSYDRLTVTYSGGDVCTAVAGQPKRMTEIEIECSSDLVPVCSVVSENSCAYVLKMKTIHGCLVPPTITPSSSPLPSPTQYVAGYNPCNAIKVKSFPTTLTNNLINGKPYNGSCVEGPSEASQFYSITPTSNGIISATTCGITNFDTIINVYQNINCAELGDCVAFNDDGCVNYPTATQSTVTLNVEADKLYYFEVRAYGDSPPGVYTLTFSFSNSF